MGRATRAGEITRMRGDTAARLACRIDSLVDAIGDLELPRARSPRSHDHAPPVPLLRSLVRITRGFGPQGR